MQLIRKDIHVTARKGQGNIQITLDEDYNVPDSKPDINQLIEDKASVLINSVTVHDSAAKLDGSLEFHVLYMGSEPASMSGSIPINEKINIDELCQNDNIMCIPKIDDLTVRMINSRKISIKAIISIEVSCECQNDISVCDSIENDDDSITPCCQTITNTIAQLRVYAKDSYRIKEIIELPAKRPNIAELIWYDTSISKLDMRLSNGSLNLSGELSIFVIYKAADETGSIQWFQGTKTFTGKTDISGCDDNLIGYVIHQISDTMIEIKPNTDGEERCLCVEAIMLLHIKAYEEHDISTVNDLYIPCYNTTLEKNICNVPKLLLRNNSRCKISSKVHVKTDEQLLSVCNISGTVNVDDISVDVANNGIDIDGIISFNIFYLTSDDNLPMNTISGTIPFSHVIEVDGITSNSYYTITPSLDQISYSMPGGGEIEVKAVVNLDAICFEPLELNVIDNVKIEPMSSDYLSKLPGIIGYIVNQNDSLWSIAKSHNTTMEEIKSANKLSSDEVAAGDKLLLVRV